MNANCPTNMIHKRSNLHNVLVYVFVALTSLTGSACGGNVQQTKTSVTTQVTLSETQNALATLLPTASLVAVRTVSIDTLNHPWTPRPSPTSLSPLIWADGIDPIIISKPVGSWSPATNEIVFTDCQSHNGVISIADAPRFTETDITPPGLDCPLVPLSADEVVWTSDGQQIVFSGPPPEDYPGAKSRGYRDIWLVGRDGFNAHPVSPGQTTTEGLAFRGWMDDHTLIYRGHSGTFRLMGIVDIATGEHFGFSLVAGGSIHPPNAEYAVATSSPGYVGVISKTETPSMERSSLDSSPRLLPRNVRDLFEDDIQVYTRFEDWLPGTNKMLALAHCWKQGSDHAPATQLILWDLDTDTLVPIAADGITGRFSPNGLTLAYLSFNPAVSGRDPETSNLTPYLQLLDMKDERVVFSLPIVVESLDYYLYGQYDDPSTALAIVGAKEYYVHYHLYYKPIMAFSPNSRYLALVTGGQIRPNETNSSDGEKSSHRVYIQLLDVETRQVVYSSPSDSTMPVWSPDSNKLAHRDERDNWVIFDIAAETLMHLTQNGGQRILNLQWSYDSTYLSLGFQENGHNKSQIAILRTP